MILYINIPMLVYAVLSILIYISVCFILPISQKISINRIKKHSAI